MTCISCCDINVAYDSLINTITNNIELVTLIALVLNIFTLIVVIIQTCYTKSALNAAQSSIELTKTSKQLEQLPPMEFIIHVTTVLERWDNELKKVIQYIKMSNYNQISEILEMAMKPQGLIDKYMFEHMPKWLSVIYESGAQYYYNSSCLYQEIAQEKNSKIISGYIDRFKESSHSIEELLKYIKEGVPSVFLNCPASKSTNDFFEE